MQKIKIAKLEKIKKFSEAKNKEYFQVILTDENGIKYSGFGNKVTDNWKVGDEVSVEVTQNGKWNNFSLGNKKSDSTLPLVEELKLKFEEYDQRFKDLEDFVYGVKTSKTAKPAEKTVQIDKDESLPF